MNQDIRDTLKNQGFFFRYGNKYQEFLVNCFRGLKIVRKLLGGRWELYCHDPGTTYFFLSWHWVENFHYEKRFSGLILVGREEYY